MNHLRMLTFVIVWFLIVVSLILSTGGWITGAFDPPLAVRVLMVFGWIALFNFGYSYKEGEGI